VATQDTLPNITAEGYFMAREINAKTGIPIGILDDNWSGCKIEPFVCDEGMKSVPKLAQDYESVVKTREDIVEWACKVAELKKSGGSLSDAGAMPMLPNWTLQHNAMIEPIVDFPICGATWYQGCSNGGEGMSYVAKLQALIGGWLAKWGYDFPFYIVQLASYTAKTTDPAGGNGYARIRNAMRIASQTIPKTGLVVAIDIGNDRDIHPKNKYDVGCRLARWALRDVYGEKDLVVSGPMFRALRIEGSRARVCFDHVGSGLMAGEKGPDTPGVAPTPTPDGKLRGFAIAGEDKVWHWADAVIDGSDVVVSSKDVAAPVAVRYAHRANPMGDCNLYNREGLPASPFRTDSW
jgi:sialate O-acetylesterase